MTIIRKRGAPSPPSDDSVGLLPSGAQFDSNGPYNKRPLLGDTGMTTERSMMKPARSTMEDARGEHKEHKIHETFESEGEKTEPEINDGVQSDETELEDESERKNNADQPNRDDDNDSEKTDPESDPDRTVDFGDGNYMHILGTGTGLLNRPAKPPQGSSSDNDQTDIDEIEAVPTIELSKSDDSEATDENTDETTGGTDSNKGGTESRDAMPVLANFTVPVNVKKPSNGTHASDVHSKQSYDVGSSEQYLSAVAAPLGTFKVEPLKNMKTPSKPSPKSMNSGAEASVGFGADSGFGFGFSSMANVESPFAAVAALEQSEIVDRAPRTEKSSDANDETNAPRKLFSSDKGIEEAGSETESVKLGAAAVQFDKYVQIHGLDEKEVVTGEEDETQVYSSRAKLYVLDPATNSWKERGTGNLHINVAVDEATQKIKRARIVMRSEQILKVILNVPLLANFKLGKTETSSAAQGNKFVKLVALENESFKHFAIKLSDPKTAKNLREQITRAVPASDETDVFERS